MFITAKQLKDLSLKVHTTIQSVFFSRKIERVKETKPPILKISSVLFMGGDPFNQNFRKISVQNWMDRFGPTGKVSKKLVHLSRWTTYLGWTGPPENWPFHLTISGTFSTPVPHCSVFSAQHGGNCGEHYLHF